MATDPALSIVVDTFDAIGASSELDHAVTITLTVKGLVVFGELIPSIRYWQAIESEAAIGTLRTIGGSYRLAEEQRLASDNGGQNAQFLHLRNTKILMTEDAAVPIGLAGGMWRCKLNAVDGWAFGALE